MTAMTRKPVGWTVILLSLAHFYYVYPLPAQRVDEVLRHEERLRAKGQITEPKSEEARAMEEDAQAFLKRESLESFFWRGWLLGLAIVLLGVATGLYTLLSRNRSWLVVATWFFGLYVLTYWLTTILPIEGSIARFFTFKFDVLVTLANTNRIGSLLIEIHRLATTLVFHVLLLICAAASFVALRKQPSR